MLRIDIKSKKFNCNICLVHKVSVFTGNSGEGKTQFVKALQDTSGAYHIQFSEKVHVVNLSHHDWEYQLATEYKDTPLFIADDCDFVLKKEFGNALNKLDKCYLIIIGRALSRIDSGGKTNNLFIDADAVYEFVGIGVDHMIK